MGALTFYGITTAWDSKDLQNKHDMINGIDDPPKDQKEGIYWPDFFLI